MLIDLIVVLTLFDISRIKYKKLKDFDINLLRKPTHNALKS